MYKIRYYTSISRLIWTEEGSLGPRARKAVLNEFIPAKFDYFRGIKCLRYEIDRLAS